MNEICSTLVAEEKSTHQCPVFRFDIDKANAHYNADNLLTFNIENTDYSYVLNKNDWAGYKGLVSWIPPDSLLPTNREEFSFLKKDSKFDANSYKGAEYAKIKARNIRGIISYGLLVKVPDDIGGDGAAYLGVHHFNPVVEEAGIIVNENNGWRMPSGEIEKAPQGNYPKYDVDAYLKFARHVFIPDEPVWVFEKLHGENSRYVFKNGKMNCGSHYQWKREISEAPNISLEELIEKVGNEEKARHIYEIAVVRHKPKKIQWWTALDNCPNLRKYCEANEGFCVYGEIIGKVKNFKYGLENNYIGFRAFDILCPNGKWMDMPEFYDICMDNGIPTCPLIAYDYPFDLEKMKEFANGNSFMPNTKNQIKEGCVVTPSKERWDNKLGRVKLKIINPEYASR